MKKIILTIHLIVIPLIHIVCQDFWQYYNTYNTGNNGFTGQYVYCFYRDKANILWIGASSGITKYDGNDWTSITQYDGLKANEVSRIVQDNNDNLWIAHGSCVCGLSIYNGTGFIYYTDTNGLINNKINDIILDKNGAIWCATNGGISKFVGNKWTSITELEGKRISCLESDNLGNIWIGTSKDGIYLYSNDSLTLIIDEGFGGNYIQDIYIDIQGKVWVASNGVYLYDGQDWSYINVFAPNRSGVIWNINGSDDGSMYFSTSEGFSVWENSSWKYYTVEDGIPHNNVFVSFKEKDGSIKIGTENGIGVFDHDWSTINTDDNGLTSNHVNSVFIDSDNNYWFCTDDGISKFNGSEWISYLKTPDGNYIGEVNKGLQDTNGDFWFCSLNGTFKFDGESWEVFNYLDGNEFSGSRDVIQDSKGNIWIASLNYLLMYDGEKWTHYNDTSGFTSKYIEALFEDSQGNIWIGHLNGICLWNGTFFNHSIWDQSLGKITGRFFLEDTSGVIFTITNFFVFVYDNNEWKILGIPSISHSANYDKNDQLWFGTNEGLIKYNDTSNTVYTTKDGLSGNIIYYIYRETDGTFIFCTDNGISILKPSIEVNVSEIIPSELTEGKYTLKLNSIGITQPYQFSVNGSDFEKNGGVIDNLDPGSYDIYITDAYDTIVLKDIIVLENGIDDTIKKLNLKDETNTYIYPNPAINIVYPRINGFYNINIYDLKGILIKSLMHVTQNDPINISELTDGSYIFRLYNNAEEYFSIVIKTKN